MGYFGKLIHRKEENCIFQENLFKEIQKCYLRASQNFHCRQSEIIDDIQVRGDFTQGRKEHTDYLKGKSCLTGKYSQMDNWIKSLKMERSDLKGPVEENCQGLFQND